MKAIILAGGKGTRLKPYTIVFPKPLVPIGDKPILDIIIKQLVRFGFKDVTLSVGHLAELIMSYFGDGKKYGIKINYSKEEKPLGTAGPLSLLRSKSPNDSFLVMNGDILTTLDYKKLINFHRKNKGIVTIATHSKNININLGIIKRHGVKVYDYIEKPTLHQEVSMGIYVFEPRILEYIGNKKLDFPDLIKILLKNNERVVTYYSKDYWLDIGRHEDYEQAQKEFNKMKNKFLKN